MAVTSPHLPTPGRQRRAVLGPVVGLVGSGLRAGGARAGQRVDRVGGGAGRGALRAAAGRAGRLAAFLWVDRWEPEPPRLLLFAFLWGACFAALSALLINSSAALVADEVLGQGSGDVLGRRRRSRRSSRRRSRARSSSGC